MRRRVRVAWLAATMLMAAGCGSSGTAPAQPAHANPRLSGSLTVFAAASLTNAFEDGKATLVAANPWLSLTYSFAGSQRLAAQVAAGARADVVATADQESMSVLVVAGLVGPPVDFTATTLRIAVAPGNPEAVSGLADLARPDLKVVLADTSVPAGRYSRQALDKAGVTVRPVSLELDVRSVLRKVSSGEADAGIVYASDVAAAGSTVTGIEIPPEHNVVATYPVAVVRSSKNRAAAQAFVDQLLAGAGRDALLAHGFGGV